ncbi:RNA-binding protein 34-like isoform X3 [Hylaeus volcanicus]|uniref:RNA-binding protein 34-like isoform X3 n=1 Tax=Hylaeus volcanicus TaxID=313075 RepID=UPI0023B7DA68|nr:RNA-binding protein 34-like isoform X3 [Hylaeus volcanicus]
MQPSATYSNIRDSKAILNDYKEGDALLWLNQKKKKRKTPVLNDPLAEVASLFEKKLNTENNLERQMEQRLQSGLSKARQLTAIAQGVNTTKILENADKIGNEETKDDYVDYCRYKTTEERKEVTRRTLFIGNVPVDTTSKQLRRYLNLKKSQIESIRFRSVPINPKFSKQRAWAASHKQLIEECQTKNAYVVLLNEEDVKLLLSAEEQFLAKDGKVLRVTSVAYDRKRFSVFGVKNTIFVGNLYVKVTEDELRNVFEENVGPVENVRIIRDPVVYISKGFGFVQFVNRGDVTKAIKTMNSFLVQKRPLHVTKALSEDKAKKIDTARKEMIQTKILKKQILKFPIKE